MVTKEDIDFILNCQYALAAVDPETQTKVYHTCMYEHKPTQQDVLALGQELMEDQEFIMEQDWVIIELTPEQLEKVKSTIFV